MEGVRIFLDISLLIVAVLLGTVVSDYCGLDFECGSGECIPRKYWCNGNKDCSDYSDEWNCDAPCKPNQFRCWSDGRCIPYKWVCDSEADCSDFSDQKNCGAAAKKCLEGQFECENGDCIPRSWVCDGFLDCLNDEQNCLNVTETCRPDEHRCLDGLCLDFSKLCDGNLDCADGSDESECQFCEKTEFQCQNGLCLNQTSECDGKFDCGDGSDELHCDPGRPSTCTYPLFNCKTGKMCPKAESRCDGRPDCPDETDEDECRNTCPYGQFQCDRYVCLPQSSKCDRMKSCRDGSDELDCSYNKNCDSVDSFRCSDTDTFVGKCISLSKVCNGVPDCTEWSMEDSDDEVQSLCGNKSLTNPCEQNNGGCSHICRTTFTENHCFCEEGFELAEDNKTCVDLNECKVFGRCSQNCINTQGSFFCTCQKPFYVIPLKPSVCKADSGGISPYLLFSNRKEIRALDWRQANDDRSWVEVQSTRNAVDVDYHFSKKLIFWSDDDNGTIFSSSPRILHGSLVTGNQGFRSIADISQVDSLAVDWVHNLLFWADSIRDTLDVAELDGNARMTLLAISSPRSVAVDPRIGCVFVSVLQRERHSEHFSIEKLGMNGQNHSTIIRRDVDLERFWPVDITLDLAQRRLYWIDDGYHEIGSVDYYGQNQRTLKVKQASSWMSGAYSMAIFEDIIYYTDWREKRVVSLNKFTGTDLRIVAKSPDSALGLRVMSPANQVDSIDDCTLGICSHLCLPGLKSGRIESPPSCFCPVGQGKNFTYEPCKALPRPKYSRPRNVLSRGDSRTTDNSASENNAFGIELMLLSYLLVYFRS